MRAYFTKKARANIYQQGKMVKVIHKNGKHAGQEYAKCDRTQPANKQDKVFIAKGESYWWWQFAFGPKIYSKTKPRRAQLTKSEFLSWLYDMEEQTIGEATASSVDDLQSLIDDWKDEIEAQRDELQERLDAMPEQLQDSSPNGERIEALDSWVSDLEAVDLSIDEDELKQEAVEEWNKLSEQEKATHDENTWLESTFQEKLQEKIDDVLNELKNCSSGL